MSEINNNTNPDLLKQLEGVDKEKLIWLAGYFKGQAQIAEELSKKLFEATGISDINILGDTAASASAELNTPDKELTILYGSHSGNGKGIAKKAKQSAEAQGYKVTVTDLAKFRSRDIKNVKNLLLIVSTHGEGEPPSATEDIYGYLLGEKAPKLEDLNYTVLALGDKSYVHFCKVGIDLDEKINELGGTRISPRVDCDVDFAEDAESWLNNSIKELNEKYGSATNNVASSAVADDSDTTVKYTQSNPYKAEVLSKINLNGKGSSKETYHIEIDLEGSGIEYKPGDSIGILANNPKKIVDEILEVSKFKGDEKVYIGGIEYPLVNALTNYLEVTVLTVDNIRKHNEAAGYGELESLLKDPEKLREFIYGRDIVDLLTEFPVLYSPQELVDILRKLPARLYSISSSPKLYENEVHLTVGAVRYNAQGRYKEGAASSYLSDRIEEEQEIPIYIKPNEGFRLPEDPSTKIIMIGPGTGIAPFRSFVDERAETEGAGDSWLFFGNPNFNSDFLYQTEWQDHIKNETLSRLNVAFSRDQKEKVYVQHKIKEHGQDVYNWINDNASIYVCGDKDRMAKDVENVFTEIISEYGNQSPEEAQQFIKNLKRDGRYQEDVY